MSSVTKTRSPGAVNATGAAVRPAFLVGAVLALAGLADAGYVASLPTARDGLAQLWLVPMAFAACSLLFWQIIDYARAGVGLKVLYAIIVVRYLVSPALIASTGGRVGSLMVAASASGYRFAIAVTVAELVICCLTISLSWPRVTRRLAARPPKPATLRQQRSGLTIGGLLLATALALVIQHRGLERVTASFGFLMLTTKYTSEPVDSFSVTAIQVMKSFLFVGIAVWCHRNYQVKKNPLWFVAAALVAVVNVSTYFGYNRSIILQTAIATIVTLVYLFPTLRRYVIAALVPVSAAVLYSLITLKQFGVSATSGQLGSRLSLDKLSNTFETYVNGPWPLATAYDAATAMSGHVGVLTVVRSYTDNFFLFKVPGFTVPNNLLNGVPSVVNLYQAFTWPARGAMLPMSGEMWFYGGRILGPAFIVLGNALAFYLLIQVEVRSRYALGAQNRFLYSWLAALFGLAMCYCLITIWWSFSKFAFFLIIVFWINNRVVLRRGREVPER